MPYTLTAVQQAAFTDRFDVYRPVANSLANKRMDVESYELVATAVPMRQMPKSEASNMSVLGRFNKDQMDTTDVIRCHMDQELDDRYVLQRNTPGHPENGEWTIIQGGPTTRAFRAYTKTFLAVKGMRPSGI